jgi:signal transduction histidine kinase
MPKRLGNGRGGTPVLEAVDGGRSRAVQRGLERLLRDIRNALGAEVAIALYHGLGGEGYGRVLARSGDSPAELPLPNEPFWLPDWSSSKQPLSRQDVVLRSALRSYRLELVAALIVPWAHTSGRGWLVAGMLPGAWNSGSLDLTTARHYAVKLRQAHLLAGLRGANRLHRDIARAAQQLAEAEVSAADPTSLLESVAVGARALLGTSAAYIALPDGEGNFAMSVHLNVRTAPFRRLRLHAHQGLGGFTSQERRPIISLNYPEDRRLLDPPITESLREGFVSAICVPLIADEEVAGLLYTANRQLTPFTEADAVLLEEFARYATLGLKHLETECHRRAVLRRLEQEQLAFQLHDSIVRSLIEIGFEAENGLRVNDDPNLRHRFERIGQAAETCLQAIREQLASMADPAGEAAEVAVGEVLASCESSGSSRTVRRSFRLCGATSSRLLPGRVASALISIGQEALRNVDLHSGASYADICLELAPRAVTLRVCDDGRGVDQAALASLLDETAGHLGLLRMRRAAADVGGQLSLAPGSEGGLCVEAAIPLR